MSEKSTIALIRRYYDAFNKGDIDGMLACLAPGFVHDVNQGGRRKGKSKFKSFCEHMSATYKEELKDIVVMATKDGSRGASEFVVHGKYIATDQGLPPAKGQRYKLPGATFFAVEDGLITRVTTHYNLNDWIRQVKG
ncbi:MAG: ketosteroid isomerase-related protein [Hyphomicrobiaceae bacterium]